MLFAALLLAWARPAHAYVEPSTGALISQLLMAAFFCFLFYVKSAVKFVKERLKRLLKALKNSSKLD